MHTKVRSLSPILSRFFSPQCRFYALSMSLSSTWTDHFVTFVFDKRRENALVTSQVRIKGQHSVVASASVIGQAVRQGEISIG